MIFVTVGTHYLSFDRLIKKMDEIAPKLNDEVIMQIGHTDYAPKNTKWFNFIEVEKIQDYYQNADVIIAHSGAGTLLDSLLFEKPIIAVPRLKEFGEHIDDQQLELAEALANMNKIIPVYNVEKLEENIIKAKSNKFNFVKCDKKLNYFFKEHLRSN